VAQQLSDQPCVVAVTAFLKRWYFWATQHRLAPDHRRRPHHQRHQSGIPRWFEIKNRQRAV
jgi:hypothetical protein